MIKKITNPNYLGVIAPLIMRFHKRVKESSGNYGGIAYESIYSKLSMMVQFGNVVNGEDRSEVWVAYDNENRPVGFAAWHVMDLPHIGSVFCPCMFNDVRNQKAIKELYEEFKQFGRRHRATIYRFWAANDKVGSWFKNIGKNIGIEFEDTGAREFIGREV